MTLELLFKGGPLMIPILLGSILGLAILFERAFVFLSISSEEGKGCLAGVLQSVRQGRLAEAISAARETEHPVGPVLRRGLELWGQPLAAVERGMEQAAQQQVKQLERWLGTLATLVSIEPMLGFLGTITGLIRSFFAWEAAGTSVTVSTLAAGIYEAMITTAAGLSVAIPLLVAYNVFVGRIKWIASDLSDSSAELIGAYIRLHPRETAYEASRHAPVPAER